MARRIDWKVEEIRSQHSTDGLEIYASLSGTPRGIFVGSMEEIKTDLETQIKEFNAAEMAAKYAMNSIYGIHALGEWPKQNPYIRNTPKIKNVIFNDPATIVFWEDGDKTVVKCQEGDTFDPEKGLAMAFVKKVLGNKGNYCNEIKKWLPEEEKDEEQLSIAIDANPLASAAVSATKAAENLSKAMNKFKRRGLFT